MFKKKQKQKTNKKETNWGFYEDDVLWWVRVGIEAPVASILLV